MSSRFFDKRYVRLAEYVPGEQPRDKKYIKLNTNESPFPPCDGVIQAVGANAARELRLYSDPESRGVKTAIAESYGVLPENVFVSNGSDESLNFLFMAFSENGAAFMDITYGFYSVFAGLYGLDTEVIPLTEDFSIDTDRLCRTCAAHRTLFIANPNAPTGLYLAPYEIERIVKSDPDRLVVVDEAYIDFGGESVVPLTGRYDNLVVVQTFSKSRQLAGARLGFAVGNSEIIGGLEKIKFSTNPYNVNRITQICGEIAMRDRDYFNMTRKKIIENRKFVSEELKKRGFTLTDSLANFVFAKSDRLSGEKYYAALRDRGILVRHFSGERISDYVRISIGTRDEMEALVRATDEIIAEVKNA